MCISCSVVSDSLRPMDYSLPGSTVHGLLQARLLEWVAISFSRESSRPGIEPQSPALQADPLPSEPQWTLLVVQWLRLPSSTAGGAGWKLRSHMSAVRPLYPPQLVMKKRAAFMGKAPVQGEWVWLLLENPNSPEGFSIAFLKWGESGWWQDL